MITVTVWGRCKKAHFGWSFDGYVQLGLVVDSTYYSGTTQTLNSFSYSDFSQVWATNPKTGNPWTWEEVATIKLRLGLAGHRASGWERESRCTQAWLVIEEGGAPQIIRPIGQTVGGCSYYGASPNWNCVDEVVPDEDVTYVYTQGGVGGIQPSWRYDHYTMAEVIPPVELPTVTTDPATSIESTSATLKGILNADGGEACACGFEWGETIAYGSTTPTESKETGETFSQIITGLDPKKTYHFRALATNSAGIGHGNDRTFTTLAVAPTVATNPAIDINNDSATLKGELTYDGGEACNCGFEYGETDAYGTTTPTQSKVTGEAFSQPITGLDPNKTYHFRAIATNSAETSHGADRTFKTLVSAPAVTTKPATRLGAVLATLNGTLDDDIGEACECGFEWGLDTDYGTITPTESKTTDETFSQVIGRLVPNTVYHFRAFATNSFGTGHGDDMSFTTALIISRAFALAREEL